MYQLSCNLPKVSNQCSTLILILSVRSILVTIATKGWSQHLEAMQSQLLVTCTSPALLSWPLYYLGSWSPWSTKYAGMSNPNTGMVPGQQEPAYRMRSFSHSCSVCSTLCFNLLRTVPIWFSQSDILCFQGTVKQAALSCHRAAILAYVYRKSTEP